MMMSDQLLKTLDILSRELYITQEEYLGMFPEGHDRQAALQELFMLEQQGTVICNREGKSPVYYVAGVVYH